MKHFLAICVLQFGTFWVASGVSLFLPDTFNQLTLAREEYSMDLRVCDVANLKKAGNLTFESFDLDGEVKSFKICMNSFSKCPFFLGLC